MTGRQTTECWNSHGGTVHGPHRCEVEASREASSDELRFEDMTCMKCDGRPIVAGTGHCKPCIGPIIPNGTPTPVRPVQAGRKPTRSCECCKTDIDSDPTGRSVCDPCYYDHGYSFSLSCPARHTT